MLKQNLTGLFPYTPATNLLYALREAVSMLQEEGLPNIFRRHDRYAEATRAALLASSARIRRSSIRASAIVDAPMPTASRRPPGRRP